EEDFIPIEMDVVGRAFAGFVPCHENLRDTARRFGTKEDLHVETEGFDRQRLFGSDDGGLTSRTCGTHMFSFPYAIRDSSREDCTGCARVAARSPVQRSRRRDPRSIANRETSRWHSAEGFSRSRA